MKSFTLWLMGPTSSGKTTLAEFFVSKWKSQKIPIIHYDGDEVRSFFGAEFGFQLKDRLRVIDTIIHLTKKANASGLNVVVSALTASHDARSRVTQELDNVVIAFVTCPIEICAQRDPKGLYKQASEGKIDTLIGWNVPYTPPDSPDLILRTDRDQEHTLFRVTDNYLRTR